MYKNVQNDPYAKSICSNSVVLIIRDLQSMLVSGSWGFWKNKESEFKFGESEFC